MTDDELLRTDPEIAEAINNEIERQDTGIELIASENFTSEAVLRATGSVYPCEEFFYELSVLRTRILI